MGAGLPMRIGKHDTAERVFVIAELGINHNGDLKTALAMQEAAAKAGADAVKYQVGDPFAYVNEPIWYRPKTWHDGTPLPYIEYRQRFEFDDEALTFLRHHALMWGLEWFASPLDLSALPRLAALQVPALKIASPMLTDTALIQEAARMRLPVLLSSGMTWPNDLDAAVAAVGQAPLAVLHCTSEYPCNPEHNNLRMIPALADRYPQAVIGYSGHERGVPESVAAVALGARIVERHFTLDRTSWGSDQAASLEPNALATLVRYIRTVESALGDGVKRVYAGERANEEKFRRVCAKP